MYGSCASSNAISTQMEIVYFMLFHTECIILKIGILCHNKVWHFILFIQLEIPQWFENLMLYQLNFKKIYWFNLIIELDKFTC